VRELHVGTIHKTHGLSLLASRRRSALPMAGLQIDYFTAAVTMLLVCLSTIQPSYKSRQENPGARSASRPIAVSASVAEISRHPLDAATRPHEIQGFS